MKLKKTAAMILTAIVIINLCIGVPFSLAAADPELVKIVVGHTNGVVTQDDVAKAGQSADLCSLEEDSLGNENWVWTELPFTVTFASGVTAIGDWAVYNCSTLTGVTLPNSVTSIGNYAFHNTALISVTIRMSIFLKTTI